MGISMNYELHKLSLEQKIGQLFVTGFSGIEPSNEFLSLVENEKVGNVILFSHNISDKEQLGNLNRLLYKKIIDSTSIIPIISVDEEGGVVTRLPKDTAIMPSLMAQAKTKDKQLIYEGAKITGDQLKALGINMNLAPVLDINCNWKNPVIGVRSFGEKAEDVCNYAKEAERGYKDAGILCCGKHFPGHGDTEVDSHLGLPVIEKSLMDLEKRELKPFIELIKQQIPAITIAHAVVKALDSNGVPCTVSKTVITEYLREKLGYKGIILSDCMEMNAMKEYGSIEKNVVASLQAGMDLIYISHTPSLVKRAVKAVKEAIEKNELTIEEINCKVNRILMAKEQFDSFEMIVPNKAGTKQQMDFANFFLSKTIQTEAEQGSFYLGNNPIFIGIIPSKTTNATDLKRDEVLFADYFVKKYGGTAITLSLNPTTEEIEQVKKSLEGKTAVLAGTLNAHLYEGQMKLLHLLNENMLPTALAALRNPYDKYLMTKDIFFVPLYEYTERALEQLSRYFVK